MPTAAEPLEQRCPSCGAGFRLADRRKRVQCPRCMEVVDIATPKLPSRETPAPATKELAELKARLVRLDALEARTETLERHLAELRGAARPLPLPVSPLAAQVEQSVDLHWHQPPPHDTSLALGEIPLAQQETLISNLSALGPRRIVIQAIVGDAMAARLAQAFRELFGQAGWTVPAVQSAPDHLRRRPLALTGSPASSPQDMAGLFMALAAAGFTPVSQIDPALDGSEPILSVGPH